MKIPTGPQIKLPKLRLRRPEANDETVAEEKREEAAAETGAGGPGATRKRVQPPALVKDVYRDLRDRHLLLPAVGLLVAIVLVPLALRAKPTPPAPAAPPAVSTDGAAAVPAVLTVEEQGIRDYRKRLSELKAKNPFEAQFQYTPQEIAEQTALQRPLREPGSSSAETGVSVPVETPGGGFDPGSGSGSGEAPSVRPQPQPVEPDVRARLLEPVVKVRVGPVGDPKRKQEYGPDDPIPGKKRPILMLLGFGDSFDEAAFLVSRRISSSKGDGRCRPSGRECEVLIMKRGDGRNFDLQRADGSIRKYRVKLLKVSTRIVEERALEDE